MGSLGATPIGVRPGRGGEWLYLFERGAYRFEFRDVQMVQPGTLLTLDQDVDRWRTMFPHPTRSGRIDGVAAGAMMMRECWAAQLRREAEQAKTAAE